MNRAIDWFARNGVAANLLMLLLLIGGGAAAMTTIQEVFPEFSLDAVEVRVTYPGASPEEVEDAIVQRVEDRVESVEGIDRILSTAAENVGVVTAELKRGTDAARARTEIKQEVDRITAFPDEAEEPVVTEITGRNQALQVALYGDASPRVVKELAQQVQDDLTQTPEISFIQVSGVRDYEISVEVSRKTLRSYGLSLAQVARIVREESLDLPGGSVETGSEEITIRTEGQNYTKTDFEDIILLSRSDGANVQLGDVATAVDGFDQNSDLITRFNGEPAALLKVFRTGEEQVLEIEEVVTEYLADELRPSMPSGLQASIWRNNAQDLRSRIDLMIDNGLLGLILVITILTLFLAPRLALWTSAGIFLSFVGTFMVMQLVGLTINMISVFGFIIATGIVVDDAIVVGENVHAEQERNGEPLNAAIRASQRIATPVIFAVLTTVAAFSPLLFIGGTIGKFLGDVPAVVIIVLLVSLVEALFVLPFHLSHGKATGSSNVLVRALNRVRGWVATRLKAFIRGPLTATLEFATRRYGVTISGGLALLMVAFSFVANGYIKNEFFPNIPGNYVTAQLEMPAGTSAEETARMSARLEEAGDEAMEELEARAGQTLAENVYVTVGQQPVATSGRTQGGFTPIQANVAEISYEMIPSENREVPSTAFEELWREKTDVSAGVRSLSFTASGGGPGGDPVSVKLFAPTSEKLDQAVKIVQDSLQRFDGVFDVKSDRERGKGEVELQLKPAARSLGLSLSDLARQVRAAFFGVESYRLQRGQNEVRVYARLPRSERRAIEDLHDYRIRTASGAEVPLEEVATVSLGYGPTQINREDGRRVVTVSADVDPAVTTGSAVTANLEAGVLSRLQQEMPNVRYGFGGQQREQSKAQSSLLVGFLLALFVIYALLAIPFRSYLQPLVIMSTVPFAWIGALLGHLLLGYNLILPSIFGIVGLSGVIVNDALVMLDFANEERAEGTAWQKALVRAGQVRFRPILLTSLTTFFGLFPFILEQNVQAQFLVPMAISLGVGILFGTAVLMLMVPALAVIQRDATAWVQTRLLGYDEPTVHLGPYE